MHGLGTVAVIGLGVLSFYHPELGSWIYIVLFVFMLQGAMLFSMTMQQRLPVAAMEPPYHFSTEEAEFVRRYRFAFKYPAVAQTISSMLAAMGMIGLILSPWLVYRLQWTQGIIIGADVILIGFLTRLLNPKYTLVVAAHRGNRQAQTNIELFNGAWRKIFAVNNSGTQQTDARQTDSQNTDARNADAQTTDARPADADRARAQPPATAQTTDRSPPP